MGHFVEIEDEISNDRIHGRTRKETLESACELKSVSILVWSLLRGVLITLNSKGGGVYPIRIGVAFGACLFPLKWSLNL